MLLSTSPRKQVPLNSGDDDWDSGSSSKPATVTKRVFFCGVVVENEDGVELSEDVRELIASFGDPVQIDDPTEDSGANTVKAATTDQDNRTRRRAMTNTSAIHDILNELVSTERSYVKRLRILKHDYADPLRSYARSKETAIIPAYEANTLFGNIDALLPVNEAFLADLERMVAPDGPQIVGDIGDVALRHFKELRGFDLYKQFYVKREEAQSILEREMAKKSRFYTFVDRIKYSSADMKNRVGLRELMMEPVQRIPRYTLMFRTMMQRMAPHDPQCVKLREADEIASRIALAEADDATKRAAVMHCLAQTVEGFPPGLVSHSRRFIDCLDVDDGADNQGSVAAGIIEPLRCTLFLFDDKIMVVKRPTEKSGRALSGLEKLEKMGKAGGLPSGLKKGALSCKGVVDLSDVVATDVGGADFHLFFESPPLDQPDRWSGRSFRSMTCVHPPSPANFNPQKTVNDKKRFLEHVWQAQVDLRARSGQSVTLEAEEREVETRVGKVTVARTYFHVYQRTSFLREERKTKVVVQIDPFGNADPLPFGARGPPYVVIHVQPIEGDLSRYRVLSSDPHDDHDEEDIVQTGRVPDRVIQTIHQYGLFKFRTGKNSAPSTPTAASRSRAAIFGLDTISRNLFGALPGTSSKNDLFGGSINGSRRSKSTTRSSTYTQSSDSSLTRFTHRSNSSSMTSVEDESFSSNKSSAYSKLLKTRSKSPAPSGSESEGLSRSRRTHSRSRSRTQSQSREPSPAPTEDGEEGTLQPHGVVSDGSDWDLTQRLALARRNSQNQHDNHPKQTSASSSWNEPVEETIYEEIPPQAIRSTSRASTARQSHRSTTPQPRPTTPSHDRDGHPVRTPSRNSDRPRGPRSPSPAPPMHRLSPPPSPMPAEGNSMEMELAIEATLLNIQQPMAPVRSASPVGRPLPQQPTISLPHTPQRSNSRQIEPLSIKKKDSLNDGPARTPKAFSKTSPLFKGRIVSPRRVSPLIRHPKGKLSAAEVDEERLARLHESAREDVESSRQAVKRVKTTAEQLRTSLARASDSDESPLSQLPSTPRGIPRTPQRTPASPAQNKAALDRMEEMRQLIGKRGVIEPTAPRPRPMSYATPQTPTVSRSLSQSDGLVRSIEEAASDADKALLRASSSQDALGTDLEELVADLKEKAAQLAKTRAELQSQKRQCELVKSLLNNAVAENALVYDTVNEELDELFKGAQLPETDAWAAMTADVRRTKAARNELAIENSQLKRQLAEAESEKEEWGALLRQHGLIS
ncbi:hypothetical protein PENSPDRAFT_371983 [Peniophora sp. CONT]|nr:hypothetical protein PENSPDRAFT_371983 [Peniophora sp. CONT]